MLGLRRGLSQLSVAQYRCFSSVKFNNVSYGNYLKEANFQVEKGEKVALMGNKMSKAAILNIVGGNLEDVSGNVTAGNKVFVYQPRQSRSEQMQSVADFLKKNADSTLSDDAIKKVACLHCK
jgi:ATPase subunit of ABC transporter with duplicated ATPase domains